jgi:hypothetical protein
VVQGKIDWDKDAPKQIGRMRNVTLHNPKESMRERKLNAKLLKHYYCDGIATRNPDNVGFSCAKCGNHYLGLRDVYIPMESGSE